MTSTLTHHLNDARRYALLSAEEEQELARRWQEGADEAALERLIGSHLRLVIKIAKGFQGYGVPLEDLIAEGKVGLMQAAHKFEPARQFRFSTYAMWWIRAALLEHVMRASSLVRLGTTAAQKKLFFNLRRLKAANDEFGYGDLPPETVSAIAQELDVSEDEVVEMNRRLSAVDRSLNAPVGEGDGEGLDFLVDETEDPEAVLLAEDETARRRRRLHDALQTLKPREREIVTERRLKEDRPTLQILSERYGVSRERIRQIETNAVQKLSKTLLAQDAA